MPDPPKKPALRRRYDDRQRAVLDTCAQVFAERGYHATTIDDLIQATGLARGGLYHYIGSKPEALTRILDDLMGPLLEQAETIVRGPADAAAAIVARGRRAADPPPAAPVTAEQRLRALVRVWMEQVETHQDHIRVFLQERTTLAREQDWSSIRADRELFQTLLTEVLQQGVDDGDLVIGDPRLAALALLGTVNHSAVWFSPGGRLTADEVADGFVDLFLDGARRR